MLIVLKKLYIYIFFYETLINNLIIYIKNDN